MWNLCVSMCVVCVFNSNRSATLFPYALTFSTWFLKVQAITFEFYLVFRLQSKNKQQRIFVWTY